MNITIKRGGSDDVIYSDSNVILQIKNNPADADTAQAPNIFRLKSVQGDYVTAHHFDGTTEGTVDVYIAKPWHWREARTTATKLGVGHKFTYAAGPDGLNRQRTDEWPDPTFENSADQLIHPPWEEDEVITAICTRTDVELPSGQMCGYLMVARPGGWADIA